MAVHTNDPRDEIWEKIGPLVDKVEMLGARVLVATYKRAEKTAGGIFLTHKTIDEDDYQGRVGLVLKMGPLAFKEDDTHVWPGNVPKVGDWVLMNIGDARRMTLGEWPTRIIEDVHIAGILDRPDVVW
jgi:co-chaperonin GroES (HSP10)